MTRIEARPEAAAARGGVVGTSLRRREDPRLLTGTGRYLADHDVAGLCHVAILRSPYPHAEVRAIDVSVAAALSGVVAVVTVADLIAAGANDFDHLLGPPAQPLRWGVLADRRVRFVGEPIAAVVASSRAVAEDALELIDVDYEELPAVVGAEAALRPGATLLYPEWGTNEFFHLEGGTDGVDAALATAPHHLTERFESHRVVGLPLEGHGVQASWDPGTGRLSVLASNQQPHQLRSVIAEICGMDESAVRVVSPDMGGGFGTKQHFTREECLVALLARITGRAIRWSQDRTESLTASVHARAQVHDVEAGYDDTGRLLALRVGIVSDLGNPVLYFSGIGPALVTVSSLSGGYAIEQLAWSLSGVATTTCPVGAYRGFGQPEAHFTTERVMDRIAAELGLDPVEVRRRNLLPDRPRPWTGHAGQRVDVGDLVPHLDHMADVFGYERWRHRQAEGRADGRFVGIGVSSLVQGTAPDQHDTAGRFGSLEMASVTVLPDGRVDVRVGTKSQGQGHETSLAQVAADALGVDPDRVAVRDGDTDALGYGQGTWGSRSAVMGGGAVAQAALTLRAKMTVIATHLGQPLPSRDWIPEGVFARIAAAAWWHLHLLPSGLDPGLSASAVYRPGFTGPRPDGRTNHDETYTTAMTAVAVEVDPATGSVRVLDAVSVLDCGVVINPMVVVGQLQGAFAQGLGVALLEEVRYSPEGQPLCATLLDYTIPTAVDVADLRVILRQTPSELAGGFRGMGETGIIAAPAVLVSAIEDALSPLGVRLSSTRAHPDDLRRAVRAGGWRPDPASWGLLGGGAS
ncbi:MAG: xanthine dehydrogenase family protein molybdopterin-binding subunit [Actinomycetota bacterium]|nr:xanthine dehydrogenase family protein molybdopterin-binding subunit [Actinomycetota bacterium]